MSVSPGRIGHLVDVILCRRLIDSNLNQLEGAMKAVDRETLAKERKLEAINSELVQHERKSRITLLLLVLLDIIILVPLAYYLLVYE